MTLLYTLLLLGLGFACLVLILLGVVFISKECCQSIRNTSQRPEDEEEGTRLTELQNNNVLHHSPGGLPSSASAPTLSEMFANNPTIRIRRNTSIQSIDTLISPEEMQAIQSALLRNEEGLNDDIDCNMVIGVHANSVLLCGYCVNLKEKWVEFYKIQTQHLPWRLENQSENSTFEMNNFFFALMLWSEQILDVKNFQIYTDSQIINHNNNRLCRKATKLLEHYKGCEGIVVDNDDQFYVSSKLEPKSFAVKVFPAKDLLSSGNLYGFQTFISKYYDIPMENFRGTHYMPDIELQSLEYAVTERYRLFIDKVRDARLKWTSPCQKCGYIDDEAVSALDINRIS